MKTIQNHRHIKAIRQEIHTVRNEINELISSKPSQERLRWDLNKATTNLPQAIAVEYNRRFEKTLEDISSAQRVFRGLERDYRHYAHGSFDNKNNQYSMLLDEYKQALTYLSNLYNALDRISHDAMQESNKLSNESLRTRASAVSNKLSKLEDTLNRLRADGVQVYKLPCEIERLSGLLVYIDLDISQLSHKKGYDHNRYWTLLRIKDIEMKANSLLMTVSRLQSDVSTN